MPSYPPTMSLAFPSPGHQWTRSVGGGTHWAPADTTPKKPTTTKASAMSSKWSRLGRVIGGDCDRDARMRAPFGDIRFHKCFHMRSTAPSTRNIEANEQVRRCGAGFRKRYRVWGSV